MALLGLLNALNSYLAYVVIAIIYENICIDRQTDRQTNVLFFQYTGAPVAPAYIEQIYGADLLKPPDTNYMNISGQLGACE